MEHDYNLPNNAQGHLMVLQHLTREYIGEKMELGKLALEQLKLLRSIAELLEMPKYMQEELNWNTDKINELENSFLAQITRHMLSNNPELKDIKGNQLVYNTYMFTCQILKEELLADSDNNPDYITALSLLKMLDDFTFEYLGPLVTE